MSASPTVPAAPPPSLEQFVQTVLRSGLLDRDRLQQAVRSLDPAFRTDANALAAWLVRKGELSQFQATKLLQGADRGLVLGPYQVLAPLGRGGMGSVYLARDTRTAQLVALKVLPPKRARAEQRLAERFRREMELCRLVSHPHLTRTFDAGVIQDIAYIAMEFIRGESLHRLIANRGPLPVAHAAHLFVEVSDALDHAHSRGLIHRDLKPSNVMVTPNFHAKVLDLGLALLQGEDLPSDRTIVGGQGYIVGTMDYIAPEQAEDATRVDARSDLYALGCSLYYALAGRPPFPGGTSLEKVQRHRSEHPEPVTWINPMVPAEFARLLDWFMAKHPANRPASARAAREALLPWAANAPVMPPDDPPSPNDEHTIHELEALAVTTEQPLPGVPVTTYSAPPAQLIVEPGEPGLKEWLTTSFNRAWRALRG